MKRVRSVLAVALIIALLGSQVPLVSRAWAISAPPAKEGVSPEEPPAADGADAPVSLAEGDGEAQGGSDAADGAEAEKASGAAEGSDAATQNEGEKDAPSAQPADDEGAAAASGAEGQPEEADEKATSAEQDGTTYKVGSADELGEAVEKIRESSETEATILLTADVSLKGEQRFKGVEGKHVTVTSEGDGAHKLSFAPELVGDVTLGSVDPGLAGDASQGHDALHVNGHRFETTEAFTATIHTLFAGGAQGSDVQGDTSLVLRGGTFKFVYGGGDDSAVSGSTSVTVEGKEISVDNLYGGGRAKSTKSGTVGGDTNLNVRQGLVKHIFGGGENVYSKDAEVREPAAVAGTAYVTLGYEGAPANSVLPGTACFVYGGSVHSTVGNVRLTVTDGVSLENELGSRDVYGCGYRDTVKGTVEIRVEGSVLAADSTYVYGGGSDESWLKDAGPVRILNSGNEKLALHIVYDVPSELEGDYSGRNVYAGSDLSLGGGGESVATEIGGDVLVELLNGNLQLLQLDNRVTGECTIAGDATARVTHGRVADFWGNQLHYETEDSSAHSYLEFKDADSEAGRCCYFENVAVGGKANVVVDGDLFSQFKGAGTLPFYSVNNLSVTEGAYLTTCDASTKVFGDVTMDNGTWHAKGYVYVYEAMATQNSSIYWDTYYQVGYAHKDDADLTERTAWSSEDDTFVAGANEYLNRICGNANVDGGTWSLLSRTKVGGDFTADGLTLQVPVIGEQNYPETAIALHIDGTASGKTTVYTVDKGTETDSTKWEAKRVCPQLGDNYIVGFAPDGTESGDTPPQRTFVLGNEDARAKGYYLKRLPDAEAATASTYFMWQVAGPEDVAPRAASIVAYEGGIGSDASGNTDALPNPEWRFEAEGWDVYIDGKPLQAGEMPFNFGWFDANGNRVEKAAPRGTYTLRAWALDGEHSVVAVAEDGMGYRFALDGEPAHVLDAKGDPVTCKVRDVTDDEGAEALHVDLFRPVYGYQSPKLEGGAEGEESGDAADTAAAARTQTYAEALAGEAGTALDGTFDENGTHTGDCDADLPHAHVKGGTTFLTNGDSSMPVGEDARIGLLWDRLLPDVLGQEDISAKMDSMAEDAAAGTFEEGVPVQHESVYADLVDMSNGNAWVGTVKNAVTVYMPYPADVDKDDPVSVAWYEGLTRDYTIDLADEGAALEDAVDASAAHALKVVKTDTGILFDVPSKEFGPLNIMWQDSDGKGGKQPGGETGGSTDGGADSGKGDGAHGGTLPSTGDSALATVLLVAGVGVLAVGAGAFIGSRRCANEQR